MDWLLDPRAWLGLVTLVLLEIVLGIDNIVFLSILSGKVPAEKRVSARRIGLGLAMGMRILLLLSISFVMSLNGALFSVAGKPFSGKDLILLVGGMFLIAKATHEIHHKLEGDIESTAKNGATAAFAAVIAQIVLIDVVFSLDSVITAVGMVKQIEVMIAAVVIAVGFMMLFANPVADFVEHHPSVKMLALSFLILIGVALVVDGFGQHLDKGYIYFAMGFSLGVEMLNIRAKRKSAPVVLHEPHMPDEPVLANGEQQRG